MSKNRFFIIPLIVVFVISVMSITVFAGSPTAGFKVFQNNGSTDADDITSQFEGKSAKAIDLNDVSGLQAKINEVNSKLKVSDFKFKSGYDIELKGNGGTRPWRIYLTDYKVPSGYVGIVLHKNGNDFDINVFKGNGSYGYIEGITSASPFYVYSAKVTTSAQTGDFAPAYVAMIALALMSCGTIFAIRAKRAGK